MLEKYAKLSLLDRMVIAVQRVHERLKLTTSTLETARIPYAVAGSSAVAAWLAAKEPSAVRYTRDVDILIRRANFHAVRRALEAAGLVYQRFKEIDLFLDGDTPRDAVRIIMAGEKVRSTDIFAAPDVNESEHVGPIRLLNLAPLVQMKLATFSLNDKVDLRDMLDVGLIDQTWVQRFPQELGERLQVLIDTPEG
ncbi:MAG: hypothetical protein FWD61_04860 [Phycisphaerales bacterium]|nr:hypothetical protein [Phycisphaerales bacterium]